MLIKHALKYALSAIVVVAPPVGFDWSPPFNVTRTGGVVSTDYLPANFKPAITGTTFYVNPQLGNNANAGTSPGAGAVATIANAEGKVRAQPNNGLVHRIVDESPDKWVYRGSDGYSQVMTRSLVRETVNGRTISALSATNAAPAYTKTAGQTNVYEMALAATPQRVFDLSRLHLKISDPGVPAFAAASSPGYDELTLAVDVATCDATPGTYYWAAGVLYVHPRDNRAGDASVQPVIGGIHGNFIPGRVGATLWDEKIDFLGGSNPANVSELLAAGGTGGDATLRVYHNQCTFQGSSTGADGFVHTGLGTIYMYRCLSAVTGVDGYSVYGLNAASNTDPCGYRVEIECGSYYNGASPQTQANGTTLHSMGKLVSVAPWHLGSYNRTAHFVNASYAWIVGSASGNNGYIGPSYIGVGSSSCALQAGGTASEPTKVWIDGIVIGLGSLVDIRVLAAAQLYYRNFNPGAYTVENTGLMAPY